MVALQVHVLKKVGIWTLQIDSFNVGTPTHFHLDDSRCPEFEKSHRLFKTILERGNYYKNQILKKINGF
ncbi:hypothetical protein LEP1GSC151_2227 [Leptospira interrogans serovar Grippotyphosa str. LT2186]|uniref:Uncharacterized protein n=1 Tax=Leptospira interrogans serovar Grippotyphosa str. LT2186 TaxID=1001599 RepID=M3HER1_LEPIR|nr:hypothetical protein LEP1GSC151_2227 [Leptospira interrogans serovar Grippotyphosa str. LT2186]EMN87716.1 hypothetical protein LEP1GSC107_0443 [Leptospira interrogans serovar Grippotyphosa str. UI 12769]